MGWCVPEFWIGGVEMEEVDEGKGDDDGRNPHLGCLFGSQWSVSFGVVKIVRGVKALILVLQVLSKLVAADTLQGWTLSNSSPQMDVNRTSDGISSDVHIKNMERMKLSRSRSQCLSPDTWSGEVKVKVTGVFSVSTTLQRLSSHNFDPGRSGRGWSTASCNLCT